MTAQSAIALTLAKVARRRRAQGKASRKFRWLRHFCPERHCESAPDSDGAAFFERL